MARMLIYEKATGKLLREALEPMRFDPATEESLYAPDDAPVLMHTALTSQPTLRRLLLPGQQDLPEDVSPPTPPQLDPQRNYRVDDETGTLRPATPAEQAEFDAELINAEEARQLDPVRMIRALGWVVLQQLNLLRATTTATRMTDLIVTATTAATANAVLTLPSATFDGLTPIEVQFQAPAVSIAGGTVALILRRSDTQATFPMIEGFTQPVGFPLRATTLLILPAGTYSVVVGAWKTGGTVTLHGGDGLAGHLAPMVALMGASALAPLTETSFKDAWYGYYRKLLP
jgi:hypothetical protein